MDKHHILPSSRKNNNQIVELEQTFHRAWHIVFRNLKVEECKLFIDLVMVEKEVWTSKQLFILRKKIMKGKVKKNEVTTGQKDRSESEHQLLQTKDIHENY